MHQNFLHHKVLWTLVEILHAQSSALKLCKNQTQWLSGLLQKKWCHYRRLQILLETF